MKQYETAIVLTPVLSEEQLKESAAKYRQMITNEGGKIIHEENWGLKKLAYPIQKKGTGFYLLFEFFANPDFIKKMELVMKRDERIMRYITISLDKHAAAYNQRKRNGELNSQKVKKETKTEESVNA